MDNNFLRLKFIVREFSFFAHIHINRNIKKMHRQAAVVGQYAVENVIALVLSVSTSELSN